MFKLKKIKKLLMEVKKIKNRVFILKEERKNLSQD